MAGADASGRAVGKDVEVVRKQPGHSDVDTTLGLSRRKRVVLSLCLLLAIFIGLYVNTGKPPARFVDGFTVTWPTADTIQVIGTRIPGGEGVWRYYIHADRWEEIPSRVVNIPHLDQNHHEIQRERFPLEDGSVTLCQGTDKRTAYFVGPALLETKHFMQVQLRDGTMTELGVIANSPQLSDWGMLPDHSGFWVKEERITARTDSYQVVIHFYSLLTHQWQIVYRSTWNCSAQKARALGYINDDAYPGCSLFNRHGDWVLVFHNADFYLPSSPKPVSAELWVDLTRKIGRLGEPSDTACLTDFSPDGQYCFMNDRILRAPDWPHGAGVVGQTYSLASTIVTMPKIGWIFGYAPEWTPDSRHVLYTNWDDSVASPVLSDWMRRQLERYAPLSFTGMDARFKYHISDLTGKEIITGLTFNSILMNGDNVLINSIDRQLHVHYFLARRSWKGKREIFQTIFHSNMH